MRKMKKKNAFVSSLTEPKMEMIVDPQWRGFDKFFCKRRRRRRQYIREKWAQRAFMGETLCYPDIYV